MAPKRRATSPVRPPVANKKREIDANGLDQERIAEEVGIIQRKYYPAEMSNERCKQYNDNKLPRPLDQLNAALRETQKKRDAIEVGDCVLHWFKRDLRTYDNRALRMASEKAKSTGVPLVCLFVVSPQDYEAHNTSCARVDFDLRSLEVLQKDLGEKNIPLFVTTMEKRKDIMSNILEMCNKWKCRHIYCNIEYEVDELRRETKMVSKALAANISFTAVHDDVVVPPETLMTGSGKQYSVYSPWFKSWLRHVHEHPHILDASEAPHDNPKTIKAELAAGLKGGVPAAPPIKKLSDEDHERLTSIWPAGEHEAHTRLERFLAEKVSAYKDTRNVPSANSTAMLSVHFSAGTLAARTAIRLARDANTARKLDGGNPGIASWISEVAWRDFYKHVLAHWPYVCMSKPFKYEYTDIQWEYNDEHFKAWTEGRTGYPIVDAAMRQVRTMSYMHNRCRMIVASFLAKDLLLDWRQGEKWFMENLIDGDFASNNGGWGFSASTGVDPQPYFRIFNPTLQSEKFDPDGEYIRKWMPELRGVKDKAVHDPYGRGAGKIVEKAGYPKPIVEHKFARERALARYKEGLGRSTANVGGGVHN